MQLGKRLIYMYMYLFNDNCGHLYAKWEGRHKGTFIYNTCTVQRTDPKNLLAKG